jgi:hypothetical protein
MNVSLSSNNMPIQHLSPHFIYHLAASYTNAVLVALLPYVSDCCQKLNVPIPTPLTMQQVRAFHCSWNVNDPGGGVWLTNGCNIAFANGVVNTFMDHRHSFCCMEDERLRPRFYGHLTITNKDQAIDLARDGLRKLGCSLVDLFADGEPSSVKAPCNFVSPRDGTNIIPRQLGVVWVIFGVFWAWQRIKASRGAAASHSSRPPAAKGARQWGCGQSGGLSGAGDHDDRAEGSAGHVGGSQ